MPDIAALQRRLDYHFKDEALLTLALTHPSIAQEQGRGRENNQRLEFLGDAVLQLALTAKLYHDHPDQDEGPLTKARARMVNQKSLAHHGRALGIGPLLLLSHGEDTNQGRERASTLADAFEALLGAIFLDSGFDRVSEVILREFETDVAMEEELNLVDNPKGELQEILQAQTREAPEYRVLDATGPDHDREFRCAVDFRGQEIAQGSGKSKKAAESDAARKALKRVREGAVPGVSQE